jgi:hypothetical protein
LYDTINIEAKTKTDLMQIERQLSACCYVILLNVNLGAAGFDKDCHAIDAYKTKTQSTSEGCSFTL